MKDYAVPKDMAQIRLHAPPLPQGEYTVFLAPAAASHQGPETIADILNAQTPFLSAIDSAGTFCVISRRSIRWLLVLHPVLADDYFLSLRNGAQRIACELTFDDGCSLAGDLVTGTTQSGQRLVDVLNKGSRFLHLETEEDLYMVNVDRIAAARPKEE